MLDPGPSSPDSMRRPENTEFTRKSPADVTIRPARPSDSHDLAVLAILDSASKLKGDVIVAEVDGRVVAAKPLDGGRAIADPFVRTVALLQLLEIRARQLRGDSARRKWNLIARLTVLHERLAVRVN